MEGSASTVEGKSSNGESSHVKSNLQDIGGKLAMAIKYKEEGTMHFKAANYKKAIVSYAKVTAFTRGLPGSKRGLTGIGEMATGSAVQIEESEEKKAIELETAALTNIAMCYLKLGEPRKTIEFCQKALTTNPSAWKSILRKSEAQAIMGNYDSARSTLNEALQMAPDPASKLAVMKEREKQISAEREANIISNAKQKKAFSKMFERDAPSETPDSSNLKDEKS